MKQKILKKENDLLSFFLIVCSLLAVYFVIWSFTGMWPWTKNYYNSYTLQACRWLQGHLDLGQNYSHLEIAEYNGKFFVSFPPFPSYVLLPFALLFGENTPDGWIALGVSILSAYYVWKLLAHFQKTGNSGIFYTVFVMLGSNMLFIGTNGWVWFFAQNLCFLLSVAALYYALQGNGYLSLGFWAGSVGCRPFNAIYGIILFLILSQKLTQENPGAKFRKILKEYWKWAIPPVLIAISYLLLNFFRFGNPLEFGHNYLPEFTQAAKGQFHPDYMKENLPLLFQWPKIGADGKLLYPKWNGMAFYLATPLFFSCFLYTVYALCKKKEITLTVWLTFCLIAIHLLCLTAHKTMGGFQFGNRYTLDTLPYVLFALLNLAEPEDKLEKFQYPFAILGIALNVAGTIAVYNNWI